MPVPALPPHQSVPAPVTEQVVAHPLGASYLFTPRACSPGALGGGGTSPTTCPLVVISHTRGRTAAQFATSPFVRLYREALTARGFAVLLSNDAGPRTWGGPAALAYLGEVHREATARFAFSGHTYAFGLSMGGLAALRSALGGPYPVRGVALLDAHVSVQTALGNPSDRGRQAEVAAAYGFKDPAASVPAASDPIWLIHSHPLPLFVAGSPDDGAVSFSENGLAIFPYALRGPSRLITLSGPHLGGSHFAPEVVNAVADFFAELERAAL